MSLPLLSSLGLAFVLAGSWLLVGAIGFKLGCRFQEAIAEQQRGPSKTADPTEDAANRAAIVRFLSLFNAECAVVLHRNHKPKPSELH